MIDVYTRLLFFLVVGWWFVRYHQLQCRARQSLRPARSHASARVQILHFFLSSIYPIKSFAPFFLLLLPGIFSFVYKHPDHASFTFFLILTLCFFLSCLLSFF